MKIAGFGDSFITDNELVFSYTSILKKHFNADAKWYGKKGSGSWDAFFTFLDSKETVDVLIFVWSAEHRLYHPKHSNICPVGVEYFLGTDPIWEVAKQYYANLHDCRKAYYEHVAFYQYVDTYLKDSYPDTKVIHLWGFPAGNTYVDGEPNKRKSYTWDEPDKFSYLYRFTHGVEVRPALINLSYRHGWPDDLKNEMRCHHMAPIMHQYLSEKLIDAIENYSSGRLIDIS